MESQRSKPQRQNGEKGIWGEPGFHRERHQCRPIRKQMPVMLESKIEN